MEISGLSYPRGKTPLYPKNRRLDRNALHIPSLQTQQHCRAMTTGSHIHKVPKCAAVVRCTAVWTHRVRASTLRRKAAQVHAITTTQSITYRWQFWCFSQTNDSRRPQKFQTSHGNLFSNLFSSSLFTYMFVYQDEKWQTCY
jgi:hypothetical protein